MSEIMRKILSEGTTPIMTDEGLLQIFNFYYERCLRKVDKIYTGEGFNGGPSRDIRLSGSKERIDDLDFDKEKALAYANKELKRLYGSAYTTIDDDFPFGRFKQGESTDNTHGYDNRIYINAPFGQVRYDFIVLYATKCKERGIPCGAKFFEKGADNASVDNMVIYSTHKNIAINLEIMEEIKAELPEFAECCGSPIVSGLNTSYYAVVHSGDKSVTYNSWFNNLSSKAFYIAMAKMITNNDDFYKSLTVQEKEIIEYISNPTALATAIKTSTYFTAALGGFKLDANKEQVFKKVVERFVDINPELSKETIIETLRDCITDISSLVNFGDTEHKDLPISFRESDYLALGVEPSSIKAENKEAEPKIKISKEQYLSLLKADKSRIRFELAKMGLKTEIKGKSEEELRQMLFDRIELDDESIIDILSGEKEQLYQFVDLLGKDDEYEHRRDYEEQFIKLMGIDRVIDAVYTVRDKDARLGRNRKWKFRDALRTVRLERGQAIFESEEFQKLKTREQRNEFIKNFSEHAKYDVEEYYDLYGKSAGYSK